MKKFILCLVIISLTITAGCTNKTDTSVSSGTDFGDSYPLKTDVTLTYWTGLNPNVSANFTSYNDTDFTKELEKNTGVKLKFIHPAQGQESEQFNLLLASDNLPDIIAESWYNFPGGPEKAIADGNIIELNELMVKYTPNLNEILADNANVKAAISTDTGKFYAFPSLKIEPQLRVFFGPIVRQDWLDELNIEQPETIDEWYEMLKAFKEKKSAKAPLSFKFSNFMDSNVIMGAYGAAYSFFVEDGEVKYGPAQPGYKDFLITMNKWYSEKLLDNNIATIDDSTLDSNILSGATGVTVGFNGGSLGKWMTASKNRNDSFDLAPLKYPSAEKDKRVKFASCDQIYSVPSSAAISTSCKNPELAAKFLDYAYGTEGGMLYNFGTEGVSYTMTDGKPVYTELITNNPDGWSVGQALGKYARSFAEGPFPTDIQYFIQQYTLPQQKEALSKWSDNDMSKYLLPRVTALPEESSELLKTTNNIKTYVDEKSLKYIMGIDSLENYDEFVNQLNALELQKAIEIYQGALARYNKR